ncbi:MAG: hypothetical protein NVSMB6_10890 [Burkholderiaceae bacterium]
MDGFGKWTKVQTDDGLFKPALYGSDCVQGGVLGWRLGRRGVTRAAAGSRGWGGGGTPVFINGMAHEAYCHNFSWHQPGCIIRIELPAA